MHPIVMTVKPVRQCRAPLLRAHSSCRPLCVAGTLAFEGNHRAERKRHHEADERVEQKGVPLLRSAQPSLPLDVDERQ